jgi:hypothetical protein
MKGFRLIIQVWTRLAWVVSCWDEWTGDSTTSTRIAGKQACHFTTFVMDPDLFSLVDQGLEYDKNTYSQTQYEIVYLIYVI